MKKSLLSLFLSLVFMLMIHPMEAYAGELTTVSSIDVRVPVPVDAEIPHTNYLYEEPTGVTITKIEWRDVDNTKVLHTGPFAAGKDYIVYVYVDPKDGYEFSDSMTVSVNGETAALRVDPNTEKKNVIALRFKNTPIAIGTNKEWIIDSYGCLHLMGEIHNKNTDSDPSQSPWVKYKDRITSVKALPGASIDSGVSLFYRHKNLKSVNLDGLDTSKVTNIFGMFEDCFKLDEVELSTLNMTSVTNMAHAFYGCESLTTLDLSGWNAKNLEESYTMFSGCGKLTTLKIGNLYFAETMNSFHITDMFEDCNVLSEIRMTGNVLSAVWEQLINISPMWTNESTGKLYIREELKNLHPSAPVTLIATNSSDVIDGGIGWYLDSDGCLHITGAITNQGTVMSDVPWHPYREDIISVVTTPGASVDNCFDLFRQCYNLVSIDLSTLNTENVRSMKNMFLYCPKLESIDLSGIDTSGVTDMDYMFSGCTALKTVELSGFDTSGLFKMGGMFENCSSLESVDLSGFRLGESFASDSDSIFSGCTSLKEIKINSEVANKIYKSIYAVSHVWNDKSSGKLYLGGEIKTITGTPTLVVNKQIIAVDENAGWYIDGDCLHITGAVDNESQIMTEDLSPWKKYKSLIKTVVTEEGASITNGLHLFAYCTNLVSADLSKLNTTGTTSMANMFRDCSNMTTLNMVGFKTKDVENMSYMFMGCSSLKSINLSSFNTSNLQWMAWMFADCSSLTTLDLRGLDISKLQSVDRMLLNCSDLSEIRLNSNMLAKISDQLISIYDSWADNATGKVYKSEAALSAVTGTVVLVRAIPEIRTINLLINIPGYNGTVHIDEIRDGVAQPHDLTAAGEQASLTDSYTPGSHSKMTITVPGYATCEVEFDADVDKTIIIDMIKNQKLSHTLSVQNNLAINYYVAQSAIPNLTNVALSIEKDVYDDAGVKTVERATLASKLGDYGYGPEHKFVYEGVASYQAINEIRASLVGEYNGVKYTFAPDVYSIETYCYNQIGKSSVAAGTKRLLVDLLNYCSASQVHFGIKADTLANRNLTGAQKALGTTTAPALNNISGTESLAGATAKFNGKTLVLGNNVELKIYMLLDNSVQKENVSLRIKYQNVNGENVVAYVPYSEFTYDSGRNEYAAKYTGLIAPEFRKVMQLTIMEGTKEISDTDTYSIETYAYNRVNGSSKQTLKDVVTEMMKYSDSALAYFK